MNKKELLEHVQKIYDAVDELETTLISLSTSTNDAKGEASKILNMLEEIPENVSEITDE